MDLRDERELALQRLTKFCQSGFVSVTDFRWDAWCIPVLYAFNAVMPSTESQ